MKLILTNDEGTLLDSVHITPEEWKAAIARPEVARLLLDDLQPGDEALGQCGFPGCTKPNKHDASPAPR